MSHPHVLVDGTWVDLLYPASDLKHSTGWFIEEKAEGSASPSGPLRASVSLACPVDLQAPWLLPGKSFQIYSHTGGLLWGGRTGEPERGDDGITLHAKGIGAALKDWAAVYEFSPGVEESSDIPNTAVDYAVTRGAPFSRNGVDLGSLPLTSTDGIAQPSDLLTLLTRGAIAQGKRLHVDSRGAITYRDDPTTASWMMTPQADYFGTADEAYVSTLRGFYHDSGRDAYLLEILGSPTSGTFTITYNGNTTGALAYNASNATIQTAVRTLGGIFVASVVTTTSATSKRITTDGLGAVGLTYALAGGTNPRATIRPVDVFTLAKAEDEAAADKFGVKERTIDLSPLGRIPITQAQDYIDGRFALAGGRMGWTSQVQLTHGNLFHAPTGLFANPRYVQAGEMLQIPGIIDARSNPTTRGSIQWVIQEVEVTEGPEPTALVTPVGFVPRDFDGLLAPPENPANREAA